MRVVNKYTILYLLLHSHYIKINISVESYGKNISIDRSMETIIEISLWITVLHVENRGRIHSASAFRSRRVGRRT